MLDAGGNCSSVVSAQVLCGFKRQCTLFAWRRGHQRRGPCGPCAGPAVPRTSHAALAALRGSIPSGSDGPIVWRGSTGHHDTRGHAGPVRVSRVPRVHAGPAGPTRVPCGSLAGPARVHFTLRGSRAPFGFLKFY